MALNVIERSNVYETKTQKKKGIQMVVKMKPKHDNTEKWLIFLSGLIIGTFFASIVWKYFM